MTQDNFENTSNDLNNDLSQTIDENTSNKPESEINNLSQTIENKSNDI
jgi:hypothetical protein